MNTGTDLYWTQLQVWSIAAYIIVLAGIVADALALLHQTRARQPQLENDAEKRQKAATPFLPAFILSAVLLCFIVLMLIDWEAPATWFGHRLPMLKTVKASQFRPKDWACLAFNMFLFIPVSAFKIVAQATSPLITCPEQHWGRAQAIWSIWYILTTTLMFLCIVQVPRPFDHFWSGGQRRYPPQNPEEEFLNTPMIGVWGLIAVYTIFAFPFVWWYSRVLSASKSEGGMEGARDEEQGLLVDGVRDYGAARGAGDANHVDEKSDGKE